MLIAMTVQRLYMQENTFLTMFKMHDTDAMMTRASTTSHGNTLGTSFSIYSCLPLQKMLRLRSSTLKPFRHQARLSAASWHTFTSWVPSSLCLSASCNRLETCFTDRNPISVERSSNWPTFPPKASRWKLWLSVLRRCLATTVARLSCPPAIAVARRAPPSC